ncbi:MAG TPA: hypothetical protein PK335_08255 [Draconibacterium sp.]|nr:hypothetical protein [Draconibacterium sp.]
MKNLKYILFSCFLFSSIAVFSQKNEVRISGEISHLFHDLNLPRIDEYQYINPKGIEFAYFYSLQNDWKIGTSLFYNWSTFYTHLDEKYDSNESGISILFKKRFHTSNNQKSNWTFSFGSYNGAASNITFYYNHRGDYWSKVDNWDEMPDSFSEKFFSDLYTDIGWVRNFKNFGIISLSPFIKYRIIKNNMNDKYTGLQFGMKLNYSFCF